MKPAQQASLPLKQIYTDENYSPGRIWIKGTPSDCQA